MVLRAQNQGHAGAPVARPPSYGSLFGDAARAVATARVHDVGPFHDPCHAANVVVDYERYLAIAGRHLRLLVAAAADGSALLGRQHRELVSRMAGLRMERRGGNGWTAAGDRLGIAHDLLATHVGPRGELRTPEARLLTRPEVQVAATARTLDLVIEPLALSRDLLTVARSRQPRTEPPLTRGMSAHLRQATAAIQRALAATPPLGLPTQAALEQLDGLTPATTKVGADSSPDLLGTHLSALQVLRQLSYRQSLGVEPANAHSLQDLCALAVATCRTAQSSLPLADTPLGRVQRAAAIDDLRRAASLWEELGHSLARLHGLAKAPPIYRDAIRIVAAETEHNQAITRAVLASLPRLAAQAAATVDSLGRTNGLVARRRAPGQLTARWSPIDAATSHQLSARFTEAAQATRQAGTAVSAPPRNLPSSKTRPPLDVPVPRRDRGAFR